MTIDSVHGYEVFESRIRTALLIAAVSVMPVALMVVGVRNRDACPEFLLFGLFLEVSFLGAFVNRIRRAIQRERRFAIGPDGVFLGARGYRRPATCEPWARIDYVVHFTGWAKCVGFEARRHHYVGVIRAGRIVGFMIAEGWSFDVARATRAAARFGGGTPVIEGPVQFIMPTDGHTTIPLPREWLATELQAAPWSVARPPAMTSRAPRHGRQPSMKIA